MGPARGSRSSRSLRSEARDLFAELIRRLVGLPPAAVYAVVGVLAAVENVFPPVPADTAVALGAFLSTQGAVSAWLVFLVTWSANVVTAGAVFVAGRTVGRSFFTGRLGRRLLHPQALDRLQRLYARHGTWGIFFSRFLPGVRAVVPPFAGVAGLGAVRALVPMAVASGIWYGALTYAAATVVNQLDDVAALVGGLNRAGLIAALVASGLLVLALWLKRRPQSPSPRIASGGPILSPPLTANEAERGSRAHPDEDAGRPDA